MHEKPAAATWDSWEPSGFGVRHGAFLLWWWRTVRKVSARVGVLHFLLVLVDFPKTALRCRNM